MIKEKIISKYKAVRLYFVQQNRPGLIVLLLILIALPLTVLALTMGSTETRKKAAACPATSYVAFTNAAGQSITSANNNDPVRAHVYLTGNIHAADIVLGYKPALLEVTNADAGINYPNPDAAGWARWLTTFKKGPPPASTSVSQEVAVIAFRVNTAQATPAEIVYGAKTTIAYNGIAGGAECGTKATLTLNGATGPTNTPTPTPGGSASPTPTPTSAPLHQCPNYWSNCKSSPTCPAGTTRDLQGQCGVGFICCLPAGATPTPTPPPGATPTPTPTPTPGAASPTPTPSTHQCLNYWTNCKNATSCPAGTTRDLQGQCGVGFICCLPNP